MNRVSSCLVALATFTVPALPVVWVASTSVVEGVMCHGRPATIVGNVQPGRLIGTPRRDVIVVGSFEGIVDARGGDDFICDSSGSDVLIGGAGDDRIFAGAGSDDLNGGPGADSLHAGPGGLADFVAGGVGPDRLFGGTGDDVLAGGRGDDHIWGGDGVDELFGDLGDDVEDGGPGSDHLLGDPGRDRLRGGTGALDVVDYGRKWTSWTGGASHHIGLTVNLQRGVASAQWFGRDQLHGLNQVWTGPGDDQLVGDDTSNTFFAGVGHDTIRGRGGTDTVRFDVVALFDDGTFSELLNPRGRVDVNLASHTATLFHLGKVKGQERLIGIENTIGTPARDTLRGNRGANMLVGASSGFPLLDGADVIDGLGGDDTILGQGGDDTLDGGSGDNSIDGGPGTDTCHSPATGPTVTRCELGVP